MDRNDSLGRKIDNITYLMELVRAEVDHAAFDSLTDYGEGANNAVEVKDVTEEDGSVLEGFVASLDREKGVIIEFRDGRKIPFYTFETDTMYDLFVRIHSELLDQFVEGEEEMH
ncbi:MAG TPA: hypothetical protein PKY31_17030 [Spirochaetota bacterium]|nr:hypothetical protein [Spirochaetota bacterium]